MSTKGKLQGMLLLHFAYSSCFNSVDISLGSLPRIELGVKDLWISEERWFTGRGAAQFRHEGPPLLNSRALGGRACMAMVSHLASQSLIWAGVDDSFVSFS